MRNQNLKSRWDKSFTTGLSLRYTVQPTVERHDAPVDNGIDF